MGRFQRLASDLAYRRYEQWLEDTYPYFEGALPDARGLFFWFLVLVRYLTGRIVL